MFRIFTCYHGVIADVFPNLGIKPDAIKMVKQGQYLQNFYLGSVYLGFAKPKLVKTI